MNEILIMYNLKLLFFLFFMQYCNQNLTITDISNTTVAVKWDREIREGTSITYRVNYYTGRNFVQRVRAIEH